MAGPGWNIPKELKGPWKKIKEVYLMMSDEEKRDRCAEFVHLDSIPNWENYFYNEKTRLKNVKPLRSPRSELNTKVSVYCGDITHLGLDAIVNTTNTKMWRGGGVCGSIHKTAGNWLYEECRSLGSLKAGEAKITGGYELPARCFRQFLKSFGVLDSFGHSWGLYFHTALHFLASLLLAVVSILYILGDTEVYPFEETVEVAVSEVRAWLEKGHNATKIKRVIFCVFARDDILFYVKQLQVYFPTANSTSVNASELSSGIGSHSNNIPSAAAAVPVRRDRSLAPGSKVKVKTIPDGFVGYPIVFDVDATDAGPGRLAVKINGPNSTRPVADVRCTSTDYFRVTFIPVAVSVHNIYVKYNEDLVPGCPYTCIVDSYSEITGTWNVPRVLEVDKKTEFTVTKNSAIGPAPFITVTDDRGKEVKSFVLKTDGGRVEITPTKEGNYWIYTTVGEIQIPGSPFECQVIRSSQTQPVRTKQPSS